MPRSSWIAAGAHRIACNYRERRGDGRAPNAYPGLPVFEVIAPAADDALARPRRNRCHRHARDYRLRRVRTAHRGTKVRVIAQACPLFVPLVEEGWLEDAETKRIGALSFPAAPGAGGQLILGCTHYPLIAPIIAATWETESRSSTPPHPSSGVLEEGSGKTKEGQERRIVISLRTSRNGPKRSHALARASGHV